MENTLGERLRSARETANLSQSELARKVGLSPQAIQHIESDKTVRTRYVNQIAGVLSVSALWLESGEGQREIEKREYSIPAPEPGRVGVARSAVSFDDAEIDFRPDTIPIFVTTSMRNEKLSDLEGKIFDDIRKSIVSSNYEKFEKDELSSIIDTNFYRFTDVKPDDFLIRPANLTGQTEAYGLYLSPHGSTVSGNLSINAGILHVSPYKRPTYGDIVIIWHRTNTFTLGTLSEDDPDTVGLDSQILQRKVGPNNMDFSAGWVSRVSLLFNRNFVKAVHTVVGMEFVVPRSKKLWNFDGREYMRNDEIYKVG